MVVVGIGAPGLTPLPIAGWLALGYEALVLFIFDTAVELEHEVCLSWDFYVDFFYIIRWYLEIVAISGTIKVD